MSSTFGSFNTVRLGIYAAQKGLDVTGNNITNINTAGYTRQRLDQVSLITSASDRYYSPYKTRVGQGVLTTGVSQPRDPGLDIATAMLRLTWAPPTPSWPVWKSWPPSWMRWARGTVSRMTAFSSTSSTTCAI